MANGRYGQKKAEKAEINFCYFCKQRSVDFIKLDSSDGSFKRKKYLVDSNGKCPDFWCKINNQEIFIEIKTLVNTTNKAREVRMFNSSRDGAVNRFDVFDPIPELIGPFENFLKKAKLKFRNIKKEYNHIPRILVLDGGINIDRFLCNAIFLGAYDACSESEIWSLQKKGKGLFDKNGSDVSALVFWNKKEKRFNGISNPRAKIDFSENNFDLFFGK